MKALITAGGHGTRLRPITNSFNKHLIPIANKPMLIYAIEKVVNAGIKDIGIVINPGDKEIPRILGVGEKWKAKITYIEQTGGALGLAHVVKISQPFIGKEPFLFYLGDNIILGEIKKFVKQFETGDYNCLLAISKVRDPQRFGVPEIKNGYIVKVEEKPLHPKSNFAVTGIYFYDYHVFEAVNNIKPSDRGELEISDVHSYLIDKGYKVGYNEITGWWKDTGKPNDLLEASQLILSGVKRHLDVDIPDSVEIQGNAIIGKNTDISAKTVIRGPAIIGENCIIKNAYIGPYTSIGNGVEIYSAEIENSIILDYVDINCGVRIVDSILGANVNITPTHQTLPGGHKLIIGENSIIEL
ncbi:glucose-1-phosphate thymidylyltransferase [Candidatus Parcubacteria bacterium 4484_255]|nr:MAG: glucose-1-phosphate thymidylyltransferase [Candidatus Parcubacteria bacterium 4484_255]